jgi:AAA family ATP:ADP antiporter
VNDKTALRVVGLCVLAWVIMLGYAVARPTVESLYLEAYGAKRLPLVWLGLPFAVSVVVAGYNRALARFRVVRVYVLACLISAAAWALLLSGLAARLPGAVYALYLLKDVYIVVLVELFWTYSNTVFPLKTARWAYGLFCVMGSLGGMVGNLGVGPLAARYGTEPLPWAMPALLLVTAAVVRALAPLSTGAVERKDRAEQGGVLDGVRVVRGSRYLLGLLALIAVVQIVITLVDYQYNALVEATFTDPDERTAVIGRVYAAIDVASIVLQVTTGLVVRALGVGRTLLTVPLLLGVSMTLLLALPGFLWMAITKVASKSLDYSWFRATKELLYLPLGYEEKTAGKGIVDVLTYRVAKAAASALLLALVAIEAPAAAAGALALALAGVWIGLTVRIVRGYRALVAEQKRPPEGAAAS